jgi:hypothetical protein
VCIFGCGWWHGLGPQVQQAIVGGLIGGMFTVLTASVGVAIVFYQLRRQAVNTITANKHNEAMKLKKDIYEEITGTCREALATSNAYWSFLASFASNVGMGSRLRGSSLSLELPTYTYPKHIEYQTLLREKLQAVGDALSRWEIAEPRWRIFRMALLLSRLRWRAADKAFVHDNIELIPFNEDGVAHDWEPPGAVEAERLANSLDAYEVAFTGLGAWIADMEIALQNALLSDLFDKRVAERDEGIEESYPVLTLEDHEQLTGWLKEQIEANAHNRAAEDGSDQVWLSTPTAGPS